jgi:lipoprotein-anchoring transpeptidase ErfK/SrfK
MAVAAAGIVVALGVAATGQAAPVGDSTPGASAPDAPAAGAPEDPGTSSTTPSVPSTTATTASTASTAPPDAAAGGSAEPSITSVAAVDPGSRLGAGGAVAQVTDEPAAASAQARRGQAIQLTPTLPPPTFDLPASSGTGRRIVYSNSQMRIWAVEEDGTVVKTHRVSGKRYIPSPGTYYVYSRSLHTYSEANPNIRWMYMVRFAYTPNGGRVGFHEIPTKCTAAGCYLMQTEDQLGEPLSGGCVRQSTPDAIWVWNWAPIGTKVVVLP